MSHYILRIPIGKVVIRDSLEILYFDKWTASPLFLAGLIESGWKILKAEGVEVLIGLGERVKFNLVTDKKEGWHGLYDLFVVGIYGSDFTDESILDIGMNIADSSIYFTMKGAKRVIGVEPIPMTFERAKLNIISSKMGGIITPLNLALTCKDEDYIELIYSESASVVSTVDTKYNNVSQYKSRKINVKTITLESLLGHYDLESVDFLKMDCEGCEYDIFHNERDQILSKFNRMIIEFHNYPEEIESKLRNLGYRVNLSSRKKTGILIASKYQLEKDK